MKKISITSSVVNGNLKRNRQLIIDALKSFEGKNIQITIEKATKKRSNQQNSFYWGVVVPILQKGLHDATGEVRDVNSIHYQIVLPLLSPKREIVNTKTGEIITEHLTSSQMTTSEFMDFIVNIQKWSAEFLQVDIPNPNEQTTLNF
jgi:hypothetical protein